MGQGKRIGYIRVSTEEQNPARQLADVENDFCYYIHALDGYETYLIDAHTFGVRPIWYRVEDRLPPDRLRSPILMTYNGLVMEGEFSNGKLYHPSSCAHLKGYCNCEEQEGITHWMPLPEPPED